ncbi:16S rRNA (guanine(527)-N(7))-methyltransferase RsmG [Sanguibacter suaedae]|uniref:Ribosomal RNA small subunit methyltransferase G n=1 Tax=Sanguibacter suaedae TaxID=2795737 RepID=A0A934MDI6_9MICO|nr:16S rRNA (guanine(527)-N(7))-methyltransferase RsmG [Sanguibacter suaedae]MBI9114839.1 16S rRNA (guanine(527)-N(7))-methyltransferase RsmG [Sanguibacter suaedae]
MDANLDRDALHTFFGSSYDVVARFASELETQGELRGLIGPREIDRIWSRHILNSAALLPFLPSSGSVADIGSGAGLPGLVVAAVRPELEVILIEPMERRCLWLTEMREALELSNVDVRRGRAEEFHGAFTVDVVTSRAVAALDKLARWSLPLLEKGGELVVLKGKNVRDEIPPARKVLRKYGMSEPEVLEATTIDGVEPTTVLRSRRGKA